MVPNTRMALPSHSQHETKYKEHIRLYSGISECKTQSPGTWQSGRRSHTQNGKDQKYDTKPGHWLPNIRQWKSHWQTRHNIIKQPTLSKYPQPPTNNADHIYEPNTETQSSKTGINIYWLALLQHNLGMKAHTIKCIYELHIYTEYWKYTLF